MANASTKQKTKARSSKVAAKNPHPTKGARRAESTKPATKLAVLQGLLQREKGATLDELVVATGWQPHSVRGAISGTLKKKRGLDITSAKVEGRGRVYRIGGRS